MSNTLNLGTNGNWATKEDALLGYNSENSNYKPLPFDFERGSTATRVNKEGLIETVGANEPRVDYKDDSKGALLLEPSRTNLVTYSEDFSQSAWVKTRTSISSNAVISPDGTLNADKLIDDTTVSSTHQIRGGVSVDAGEYTMSIYAKKGEYNFIRFWEDGISGKQCYFDLDNGIATNVSMTSVSIENIGDGWYHCIAVLSVSSGVFGFRVNLTPNGTTVSYNGTGTDGLYIWGAQLEQGSYPTSLINTQGTVQTRLADSCSQTPPDGVIGQTEGTIYAEVNVELLQQNDRIILDVNDNNTTNRVLLSLSGNRIIGFAQGSARIIYTLPNKGTYKFAFAYKSQDFSLYVNGVQQGINNDIVTLSGMDRIFLGHTFNINNTQPVDTINEAKLYNTRLSNSELQALTQV